MWALRKVYIYIIYHISYIYILYTHMYIYIIYHIYIYILHLYVYIYISYIISYMIFIIWNSCPDLSELCHLLPFGTSLTRAGGEGLEFSQTSSDYTVPSGSVRILPGLNNPSHDPICIILIYLHVCIYIYIWPCAI